MRGNQPAAGRPASQAATPAERLRSLLVAARSLSLQTPGHQADLVGRHHVAYGRLVVELPAVSCMARHLRHAGEVVTIVEVTDLAPVPIRDRVRARATLGGWLTAAPPNGRDGSQHGGEGERDAGDESTELTAVFELATAELRTSGSITSIAPEAFAAARPDPLAQSEADLLCHLADHHPETVERLAMLITPHRRAGARRIRPLALDRFGIALRVEHSDHDSDVRLDFPAPVENPDRLTEAVGALLAGCPGPAASHADRDRPAR
ncbi:DUF2470 domain-containing protein [Plantactinospora sp. WMMC1484]|uniref:DUF2470 domain-containing protein n=1 Tax=Plantactinospora sp. WMMC1484 TaxID=3404122 RepID=UPI003BF606DE